MLKVIDNFLTKSYSDYLSSMVDSPHQEWYFQKNIASDITGDVSDYGFNFWVWDNSRGGLTNTRLSQDLFPLLCQIKDLANCENILRSRLDMTTYLLQNKRHLIHVDLPHPHITAIYYFIDSDGDTIIYNQKSDYKNTIVTGEDIKKLTIKEKVSPRKNRLVIFDGDYFHTGNSPTQHSNRILLNSNFN
jgi:hypothetical protein